jgi:hypothetical protein
MQYLTGKGLRRRSDRRPAYASSIGVGRPDGKSLDYGVDEAIGIRTRRA